MEKDLKDKTIRGYFGGYGKTFWISVYTIYFQRHSLCSLHEHSRGLMQGNVWNKLAKRELYRDLEYPIANKAEDGVIMTQLSFRAKYIGHANLPLYFYFANIGLIMSARKLVGY